jgi:hypothetical protein
MKIASSPWLLALTLAVAATANAQTATPVQTQTADQLQTQAREQIYRGELLSEQERNAYMERMRLAKTEQEREQIRQEHREKMDARQRNTHQNKPSPQGSGMGKNQGSNGPILLPKQGGGGRN